MHRLYLFLVFLKNVLPSLDINSSIAEGGLEGQETTPMLFRISDPDVIVGADSSVTDRIFQSLVSIFRLLVIIKIIMSVFQPFSSDLAGGGAGADLQD